MCFVFAVIYSYHFLRKQSLNKKVLLRECKRHTLTPPPPSLDWPLTWPPPPPPPTWIDPPQVWTDWKHYLPHPSDAGGKNHKKLVWTRDVNMLLELLVYRHWCTLNFNFVKLILQSYSSFCACFDLNVFLVKRSTTSELYCILGIKRLVNW